MWLVIRQNRLYFRPRYLNLFQTNTAQKPHSLSLASLYSLCREYSSWGGGGGGGGGGGDLF